MPAVTVSASDNTQYEAVPRQLLTCLDTAPDGRDRPQMKNGRDDDRLAAVLVPLIWRESDWRILMTKRAAHLSHHAGQISFPGGALDTSDKGLIDTALREAHEIDAWCEWFRAVGLICGFRMIIHKDEIEI